ncbi:MAG: AraC family transcriptional regulator [Rhodomicrobium sp.]
MPNLSQISTATPSVDFSPASITKRQSTAWRGLQVETFEITHREPFEYKFHGDHHLLIVAEQASRDDGETCVEGLPKSTLREFSGKMSFVPAGHRFRGWQKPRLLLRTVLLYIDPKSPILPSEVRFNETELKPRLFFPDRDLWETAQKLKREAEAPSAPHYAEALGTVLAHELMRMNSGLVRGDGVSRGGLAAWQKRRAAAYLEEHLAEEVPLPELAAIAGLSPFHFSRAFKESFGVPPHRYHMIRRIERAKELLAHRGISVTEAGLQLGFSETSSFSTAFRKIAQLSPSQYQRSLT